MASVREHLKELHIHHGEHHAKMAKAHQGLHEHFTRLADCMSKAKSDVDGADEMTDSCREIGAMHKTMSAHHTAAAEFHLESSKDLDRAAKAAMGGADPDAIQPWPTGLAKVIPDRAGIRSVPRGGQPQPLARANVPVMFEDLVKIEDD